MRSTTTKRASRTGSKRVIAYARVSDTTGREDHLQSPEIQLRKIREEIARRDGWRIVNDDDPFIELDESGANLKRPKLMRAIQMVEAGEADVIAVYMLSRFARSTAAAALIERIEAVGGEVLSVSEPGLGDGSISGTLLRNIMLAVDQHQRDLAREHRRNAREKAIRENQHLGRTPIGYRAEKKEWDAVRKRWTHRGRLIPDPVTAPIVTGIFERRANGESWRQIGKWVRSHGLPEPSPGRWVDNPYGWVPSHASSLAQIVRNRAYLGVLRHGEFELEDAHEPLTDLLTFRRANAQRGEQFSDRGQRRVLAGLVRCAGCRSVMRVRAGHAKSDERPYFVCRNASVRPHVCAARAQIVAHRLEEYVLRSIKDEIRGRIGEVTLADNEPRLIELREAYRRDVALREEWETPEVQAATGSGWVKGLGTRRENEQRSLRALLKAEEELIPTIAGFDPDYLASNLESMAFEEQQQVYRSLIETIFVRKAPRRGRFSPRVLEDRVVILMAPYEVDLPVPGKRFDWRPFDW